MDSAVRNPDQRRDRLLWSIALLGVALWVGFGGALGPECRFHVLTGLHCPGCGGTRALRLLLHGDILGSLQMNALVLPSLAIVTGFTVRRVVSKRASAPFSFLGNPRMFLSLIAGAILFSVLRNLPVFPFTQLTPH